MGRFEAVGRDPRRLPARTREVLPLVARLKVTDKREIPALGRVPGAGVYANVPGTLAVALNGDGPSAVPNMIGAGDGQAISESNFGAGTLTVTVTCVLACPSSASVTTSAIIAVPIGNPRDGWGEIQTVVCDEEADPAQLKSDPTIDGPVFGLSRQSSHERTKQHVTISRGKKGIQILTADKIQLRQNIAHSGDRTLALDMARPKETFAHRLATIWKRSVAYVLNVQPSRRVTAKRQARIIQQSETGEHPEGVRQTRSIIQQQQQTRNYGRGIGI